MAEREVFGPYRMAGRTLVAALGLTVGGGGGLIAAVGFEEDIPVALRTLLVVVLGGAAGLALWSFGSSTRADKAGLELRKLWMRRRIPWPQVQDIRVESSIESEAMGVGASAYTVVYEASGRRRALPYLDNLNLSPRGLDVRYEVEAMRAAWERHRGPSWTPGPVVVTQIRDRERNGDPILRAGRAAMAGGVAGIALLFAGFFLRADRWGAPWSWPFSLEVLVFAPLATAGYSLIRRLFQQQRRLAAPRVVTVQPLPLNTSDTSETSDLAFQVTPGGIVLGVAISPDGTRVAVVTMADAAAPNIVREYDRVDPTVPLRTWSVDGPWVTDVLHLGDAIVIRVEEFMGGTRLVRFAGDSPEDFGGGIPLGAMRQIPDGFVAVVADDLLAFGTADEDDLRPLPLAVVGVPRGADAWTLATDPAAGLIALGGRELVVLDARTGALVARARPPRRRDRVGKVAFAGDGLIVTQLGRPDNAGFHDTLASWRLDDTTLTCQTTAPIGTWGRSWPAGIPALDLIATVAFGTQPHLGGPLLYFDAATFASVAAPSGLDRVTAMPPSPFHGLLPMIRRSNPDTEDADTAELHRISLDV